MDQEKAIQLAIEGYNIFLTGNAGTGKTYTLQKIIKELRARGKTVAVTASTGIAATLLDGQTIHAWAGIGIKKELFSDDFNKIKYNRWSNGRIYSADVLIIDEISMLPDYCLDLVDEVCRFIKNPFEPFGNIQVIVCGDFFQLPPVVEDGKQKPYCFNSRSWQDAEFKVCYLEKIYRQSDSEFIDLLNSIRKNKITPRHKKILDSLKQNSNNHSVKLFCKNKYVDGINAVALNKIPSEAHIFDMTDDGSDEIKIENLKKNCLAPKKLIIKIGAKVMILVNDQTDERRYVNGTMGEVVFIGKDEIGIELYKNEKIVYLERHTWKMEEYDPREKKYIPVASITQFPVKLAWAITVHKSQGATFENVDLDLSDAFVEAQGYVALSRVTSLDGLQLRGYNAKALRVDPEIIKHDEIFIQASNSIK